MYSYCDQNVFDVPNGDRLLLWGMRAWVSSVHADMCPFRLLVPVFCRMGVIGCTIHFHRSMSALHLGGAPLCPLARMGGDHIGEQEAVLLALWGRIHEGHDEAAIRTIECLVIPDWVTSCFEAMKATSAELMRTRPTLFHQPERAFPAAARPDGAGKPG